MCAHGASGAVASTAGPGVRSAASSVRWSAWVVWGSGRSRVDALLPRNTRGWSAQPCQPCTAMRRYARWGGRRVKARTRGRPQLLQAAQPHHQRRCAGHTGLQVMLRAHRAVSRVDGLAQAGRVLSGGAAHLQAREISSAMLLSLTDSEMVTGGSSLSSASTCERRAGDWQHPVVMSAARRRSSVPGCTCSQVLVVAVDEVGARNFR